MTANLIVPDWPASSNVHAFTTTRGIGNLAEQQRDELLQSLNLPSKPIWLKQVHGNVAVEANLSNFASEADASFCHTANTVCVVLTADCLPILLTNDAGTEIAAIHAGWRGLSSGVIESTVNQLQSPTNQLMAWLGPAIGPTVFEVGPEVRQAFINHSMLAASAFVPSQRPDHWLANLYELATQRLEKLGISRIYGGNYCTYSQTDHFYSYRREPNSGRMASLIWFD